MEQYEHDSTIDGLRDLMPGLLRAKQEPDEEKKKVILKEWSTVTFPRLLAAFEKKLEVNGDNKFLVGKSYSIADFILASICYNLWYNELFPDS